MSNAGQDRKISPGAGISGVHIALDDRSYDIHIGRGLLPRLQDFVPFDLNGRSLFILTDENVLSPHADTVRKALGSYGARSLEVMALPPGEKTKSLEVLEKVLSWLLDNGVDRDSVLFAVGGGVIGDIGGFAASVVLRGIPLIQVPTTLLAQADSAVGGKTGINMPQGKNLAGTFYQPRAVICDSATLATLPRRQLLAGYAEIVKYALIGDPEFFIWLEKQGQDVCALEPEALARAVETACRKKAEIVAADETEKGARALLNLGHTFGHALEAAAEYDGRLLHGEAVSIGMVLAFRLSERLGICEAEEGDRVESHLERIGLPVCIGQIDPPLSADAGKLTEFMDRDKKATMGARKFIVVNGIGKAQIKHDVPQEDVIEVLNNSMGG